MPGMNPKLESPPRRRAAAVAALLVSCTVAPLAAQLPAPAVSSPEAIHLGGYGSVVFGRSEADAERPATLVDAGAAALLLSGTLAPRLSYFGEVEAVSVSQENWTGRREEQHLEVERLYGEYAFGDALRLRVGRFLTPVGQWNEIHAEPLTWTALRPLTTYRPFAKSTTGVLAAGMLPILGRDLGYAAYIAPPRWSREEGEESGFARAAGGRIAIELLPGLVVGTSVSRFNVSRPYEEKDPGGPEPDGSAEERREAEADARSLFAADLSWKTGPLDLLSEGVALSGTATRPAERGAFLQAAVRLFDPLHLVLRTETYDPVYDGAVHIQTVGLTYRPLVHATFKLERQFTTDPSLRVRDGWFASASALF